MNPYTPSRSVCRSSLIVAAIVFLSLALVLTIILIEPSSAQKQIPSEEAGDFVDYLGSVCGHVASVRQYPEDGITLLLFDSSEHPSFVAPISIRDTSLGKSYEGREVCVAGRIVNEWGEPGSLPSIRVADESQVSLQ